MKGQTIIEVQLAKASMLKIDGDGRGVSVFCLGGTTWVTQEGDLEDHFLESGKQLVIGRSGLVVIQAITDANIRISEG